MRLAHRFALKSEQVRADMMEISEFPHLAQKYDVMGVPKIVINENIQFVGALPEELFLAHMLTALSPPMMHT